MTREEAHAKLLAETRSSCTEGQMVDFLDMAAALGVLKFDVSDSTQKITQDRVLGVLIDACKSVPYLATCIQETLSRAGLKIVEA